MHKIGFFVHLIVNKEKKNKWNSMIYINIEMLSLKPANSTRFFYFQCFKNDEMRSILHLTVDIIIVA